MTGWIISEEQFRQTRFGDGCKQQCECRGCGVRISAQGENFLETQAAIRAAGWEASTCPECLSAWPKPPRPPRRSLARWIWDTFCNMGERRG